jgi:hypothetical protein
MSAAQHKYTSIWLREKRNAIRNGELNNTIISLDFS